MAWTPPPAYTVGQVMTAAYLNTNVRDNLLYLHGDAGVITFNDGAVFLGGLSSTGQLSGTSGAFAGASSISGSGGNLLSLSGSSTTTGLQVTMANVASQNAQLSLTNTGQRNALIYLDRANDKLRISQNGTTNPAININASGDVGLKAVTSPQGMFHGYDTIGGFIYYEFDGVDGTARTVIPNAAGDVLYILTGMFVVRHSGTGATSGVITAGTLAPGGTQDIYSAGGNILQFQININGAVSVQRTAGTGTYKVALWLIWL